MRDSDALARGRFVLPNSDPQEVTYIEVEALPDRLIDG